MEKQRAKQRHRKSECVLGIDTVIAVPFKSKVLIFQGPPNSHFDFQLRGSDPPFEDIALKFIQMEDSDALQEYLNAKLQSLGSEDRAQRTMVAAWLTELHLDKINRALLEVFTSMAIVCAML